MVSRISFLSAVILSLIFQRVDGQAIQPAQEIIWENITVSTVIDGPAGFPGEPVFVTVDVLSTLYFTGAVQVSPPDSRSSLAFELGSAPVSIRDRTKSLTGVRFRFLVIPQAAGPVTIPGMNIKTKGPPEGSATSRTIELQSADIVLDVKSPPSSFSGAAWLTASRLTVADKWLSVPDSLRAGDAVYRVVTVSAEGTAASLIPLDLDTQLDAVAVYPGTPITSNEISGNQIIASRSDTVVYVFERGGEVLIPKESVRWWNSAKEQSETVVLESISFTVLENPTTRSTLFDPDSLILATDREVSNSIPFARYGAWVVAFLLTILGSIRIYRGWAARRRRLREAWANSRDGKIAAFLNNAEPDDPHSLIADVYKLIDSLHAAKNDSAQIRSDLTPFTDISTKEGILTLLHSLFGPHETIVATITPSMLKQLTSDIGTALSANDKKSGEEATLPPHTSAIPPLNK